MNAEIIEEQQELEEYYREYMQDLNIRKGKGWIKNKKLQNEDGSNGSNKSLDRGGDDDDDDEGHARVMLG